MELRLSALVKSSLCLWDLSAYKGGADLGGLREQMKGRAPPMSPDGVGRELREGVASGAISFTAASDVDLVIKIYTAGFVRAFETYNSLNMFGNISYSDLGWGKAEVPTIVEALKYAEEHCDAAMVGLRLRLGLTGNKFDAEDKAALKAAVEDSAMFELALTEPKGGGCCTIS